MYFCTNVMFRTLHSNSTIYLSTRLPFGDVKPHAVVLKTCMMGVGRLPIGRYNNRCMSCVRLFSFQRVKGALVCIDEQSFTDMCALLFRTLNVSWSV